MEICITFHCDGHRTGYHGAGIPGVGSEGHSSLTSTEHMSGQWEARVQDVQAVVSYGQVDHHLRRAPREDSGDVIGASYLSILSRSAYKYMLSHELVLRIF